MHFFSAGPKKILGAKKKFTSGENGQLRAFYFFSLFYLMLTSILPRIQKFTPIIEKHRKKLVYLIYRFPCNDKIRLFCSPELYYITVLSL